MGGSGNYLVDRYEDEQDREDVCPDCGKHICICQEDRV